MQICITTSTGMGQPHILKVEPTNTIQQLKDLFVEKLNTKKDIQSISFIFDGEILDDNDSTIASYGIEDKSTIDCVDLSVTDRTGLLAGMKFVDIDNNQGFKKKDWSKAAPSWRKARRGLCLEGVCGNDKCNAFKHRVVMPIGYGEFDIVVDTSETTAKCPLCKKYVEPITCGFNNCWWIYTAIKDVQGEPPKRILGDWQHANDAYHYFDDSISGIVTWRRLHFNVVKRKPIE
ncbi:unnamed protein product [Adineta steineri]|uniref:Ubiquitin-like domain-containing protein n=1 Tax=Adineta steineri TaxID=433720 RepID=A0A815K9M4_9BILA|nr:unnamed protein product [Adineta steineri]CAF4008143.1 unnamed protein product [Adineta steineri]